ncbi:hypothetical protein, partial [Bradyrhizobium iriomotense]|uniref:hypothetical protein n=1 Tax=Bradyrhizobium iriomotense TaxID=441950 RepID=UPI001B8A729D
PGTEAHEERRDGIGKSFFHRSIHEQHRIDCDCKIPRARERSYAPRRGRWMEPLSFEDCSDNRLRIAASDGFRKSSTHPTGFSSR